MTERRTVRHGPFMGYVSSLSKDLIPDNAVGPDSRDYRYNPTLGKFIERDGTTTLGTSLAWTDAFEYRTRELFEFPQILDQAGAQQFSSGYPSYGAIYDRASSPTTTQHGKLYFRSSNSGGSDQFPGKSWSSTTYPLSGAKSYLKALPCWNQGTQAAGTICTRLGAGLSDYQKFCYGGARRKLISGKWMYTAGLHVEPRRWNMLFNDSSSSPTRKERHWPMGILPVLFPAWFKTADLPVPGASNETWEEGDSFFASACFVFEDGTWGPPFIPSPAGGSAVTGGFNDNYGLVTLHTGSPGAKRQYIPWRNIAQPPPGCTHTAILRTPKVNVDKIPNSIPALTTEEGTLNLGIVALIPKGVTSYNDYGGNDAGLLFDPERVRADHISPPRARYIGAFDGRVCLGYTLPSPQLIYLAHTGTTNPNDNTDDDDATLGTTQYYILVSAGTLYLRKSTSAFPSAPTSNTITLSGKTLQELVTAINATTVSSTTGEWRAQLAPGVVGSLPASTTIMATANAGGVDAYGDDGLTNDGTKGNMRSFAQGYPAVLHWDQADIVTSYPAPDREGFWFTRGAPQSAAVGVTSAPNFWVAGNYRKPPEHSGTLQGFAPLDNGMVVFYSEKVWLFRNTISNRSGRDEDYYFALLSDDGCIAWDSIVSFNNAVGWLTRKGYKVSGGQPGDERLITNAIYDPTEDVGDLAYEIAKCIASTAADTDDARFHAHRFGHALSIKYRSSSSASTPDFEHEYDFSEGAQSGGLAELLRPDGTPFGWSAPFRRPGEAMGEYRNSTGIVKLQAVEEGRIDQIETGFQDNGVNISTVLYTRMDDQGEIRRRKRERRFALKFKNPPGHGMIVTHSRDRNRDSATVYTMQHTGSQDVATEVKRIKLAGQAPGRVSEYKISGTRSNVAAEVWMLERELKVLDTPLDGAG